MSPLMMRIFTLVGIALAATSLQLKAADAPQAPHFRIHAASAR